MNEEQIIIEKIHNVMNALCLDRMPTKQEMESMEKGLYSKIARSGGIIKWANILNLPLKTPYSIPIEVRENKNKEDFIIDEIKNIMQKLNIKRMPSFSEIREHSDKSVTLLNLIRRNGGYQYWANKLDLDTKDCETKLAIEYENLVIDLFKEKGFKVENMTIKHPYDLLVNDVTKVDVKVAHIFYDKNKNTKFYKYGIHKKYHTSDFYILIALTEEESILKTLIIPSHIIKNNVLSIGIKSKYDKYKDRWDLIEKHSVFMKSLI